MSKSTCTKETTILLEVCGCELCLRNFTQIIHELQSACPPTRTWRIAMDGPFLDFTTATSKGSRALDFRCSLRQSSPKSGARPSSATSTQDTCTTSKKKSIQESKSSSTRRSRRRTPTQLATASYLSAKLPV